MNPATPDSEDPAIDRAASGDVFSARSWMIAMLEVEAALVHALARHGVIDNAAAEHIAACCNVELIEPGLSEAAFAVAANPADALLRRLGDVVAARDEDAANYVHWGASHQDLVDTATVLRLRVALCLIQADLDRLLAVLSQRADQHRHSAQIGRAGLRHALPITFGLKVAGWIDGLLRHQQRLQELRPRLLVAQIGGAAGTLAGLGDAALPVAGSFAAMLDLALPDLPWQTQHDRFAEVATTLGLLIGSLGRMAHDIALLMQDEVAELALPVLTMQAHPAVPAACAIALAAAQQGPALVAVMLAGLQQEHERGLQVAQSELDTLHRIVRFTSAALAQMLQLASTMTVDAERMRRNLDLTQGRIMAEPVLLALARKMGTLPATELVWQACQEAAGGGEPLRHVLDRQRAVTSRLTPLELDRLLDPAAYTGQSASFVERVLQSRLQQRERQAVADRTDLPEVASALSHCHYEIDGAADAPWLVLSNALGTSLDIWMPQMPDLLPHFRVLRYDTRGHGQSAMGEGPASIGQLGEDVIALMDYLGIARANFCGLSLGGMTGLWLAAHHPARIERMVVSNAAPLLGPSSLWDSWIELVRQRRIAAIMPLVIERWFTDDFRRHAVLQVNAVRAMLLSTSESGFIAACTAIRDMDLRDSLVSIHVPTLVIGCKRDKVTAPAQTRRMAEHIAGSTYLELNAAHLPNWEVAQRFNADLVSFLRRVS
ncbi:3-oxoadipate enol-lactonase [Actimicrobium antarcticum]|uniref:Adenylosuccinate lyase C-terminal domain-containing protein n=1 Tax=Actimicrobium antarcticum TaxID=1051899 RepID=A0ABP7SZG0_9BURK